MSNDVTDWLEHLGLGAYASLFTENDIDWQLLPELDQETLKDIGIISAGHRLRILKAAGSLKAESTDGRSAEKEKSAKAPFVVSQTVAERRHLTVMFCDLVGSTALAEQLDLEEFRDIIRSYQDACAGAITRFDGYVARFVGDGLLVYFGFPRAHEDDAERAIRAALGILSAVQSLSSRLGRTLEVRIGIATGRVVVGDIIGDAAAQEQAVIGETPNLAARLQGAAAPDSIVISASTRELIGEQFKLEDLGARKLKGISAPVKAWRILEEQIVASRFGAAHAGRLTTFVGREQEVELLLERWRQARTGEGQMVLLSGEAGIGKSRIIHALRGRFQDERQIHVQYQCSPHHTNSPLNPAIQHLTSAAGIKTEDTSERKLEKLEAYLRRSSAPRDAAAYMAALLSIPVSDQYRQQEITPQENKQKTLLALLGLLEGLTRKQPVLFILEDAHWIDPTTEELMELIADGVRVLPVLVLVTHRPEYEPPWAGYAHCTVLALNRLGQDVCTALISDISGGRDLPEQVLEQIISKTDGVPLFVEELTKTVLESDLLEKEDDRYILNRPLPPLAIPSTLQDSLMARLDRLEGTKEIGQIGAAIGREFSHDLLDAVSPLHGKELKDALAALVESGIVFRRGVAPNATYVFKHALIQDAAYEALLHSRRREIHARIAEVLQSGRAEDGQSQPEVLAHHYTEAGLPERAAPLWLEAGQRAVARSANHEAIAHLGKGLSVLESLPRSKDVCSLELDMHISLGTASIAARGYSSVETEQAYVRGRELLEEIGDDPRQFAVLHGLSVVYINQAKLQQQLAIAEEMFRRAEPLGDPASSFVAHRVMAVTQNARGRFAIARDHAERAAALYDPDQHRNSAHQFGHDQGVSTYWNLSVALMFLGFADASSEAGHRASELARKLEHANTTLYNSLYTAFTSLVKRDWAKARRVAESMIEDAATRSMALWVVFGRHHLGSALAAQGEPEAALMEIHKGRDEANRLNHWWLKPMTLRFEAQALAEIGRIDEALSCLDEGTRLVSATQEHWWESEILRFRGELNHDYDVSSEQCEASFVQAIDVARRQDSKLLELRAATSLGRIWRDQGKHEHARGLVAPICDWFTEGVDTVDLRDARALLDELSC